MSATGDAVRRLVRRQGRARHRRRQWHGPLDLDGVRARPVRASSSPTSRSTAARRPQPISSEPAARRCSCAPTCRRPATSPAMVESAVSTFGGLDVAVNAAAIEGECGLLADTDEALFDRLDRGKPQVDLPVHEVRDRGDARTRRRRDRQHRVDELVSPTAAPGRLHRLEVRRRRDHQGRGDRLRAAGHPHQRRRAGRHRHTDAAQRDRSARFARSRT